MSLAKKIGVLALQGGFAEHASCFEKLGHEVHMVRQVDDLNLCEYLVIPGGESTSMRHPRATSLLAAIRQRVLSGMPCWGTCAGAIILAEEVLNYVEPASGLKVLRNAYGSQSASFVEALKVAAELGGSESFPGVFIRAPRFTSIAKHAIPIAWLRSGECVALRFGSVLLTSFHPELVDDLAFHRYFADFDCR